MKITPLQNNIKFSFYGAFMVAAAILVCLYITTRHIKNEKNKSDKALEALQIVETISTQINKADSLLLAANPNKITITSVVIQKNVNTINDKLASLNNIQNDLSIGQIISFKKMATELMQYYSIAIDSLNTNTANNLNKKNTTETLLLLYNTQREIVNKLLQSITASNQQRGEYNYILTLLLIALAITLGAILLVGYLIILKCFKNSHDTYSTLSYNTTLLSNISDAIITVDKDLAITNWNKYAEEIYGYTETEVKGKLFFEVLQLSQKNITAFYKIAAEKGVWKGEMTHLKKDNTPVQVEVSTSAIYDSQNIFIGGIAVVHNITHRVKMQNELQQLSQRLQKEVNIKSKDLNHFFERIAEAYFILDNNWNYVYINNTSLRLHGKTKEELIGKNIWELYPSLVGGEFYEALYTARRTQVPSEDKYYFKKNNKWYKDLIYPDKDGISIYYSDITIAKKAEIELKYTLNKLSFYLTNTPLAVLEFDSNANILQWSKKAELMFGYSAEDIAIDGIKMHQLIYNDDHALYYEKLNLITQSNLASETIYSRGVTKAGAIIFCEWYNSFLKNDNGTGVMLALVKDVTQSKQTEIDLINAEAKFRSLVEDSLVGVYIRKDSKLLYVNPRFANIFGYTVAELEDNFETYQLIKQSNYLLVDKLRKEKGSEALHYEFEGIKKDGTSIYIELFGNNTILNNEPVFLGTIIDVTERKLATIQLEQSQRALKKSNESFEIITTATKDAIWDWDINKDTLMGNERFYELFGAEKDSTLHFDDFIQRVHKDDRGRIMANSKLTLEKKGKNITEEFRLKQPDGNYKILIDRVVILYDEDNEAYRMLGAMQDITESKIANKKIKQSQLALKKSNERYEYIAKATKDAIFDWDIEHDLLTGNDVFLSFFGMPPNSKFKFIKFFERMHDDDKVRLTANFRHALRNKSAELSEEFKLLMQDGSYRIFSEKAYLLYNHNNRAYRAFVALRDITEIKNAENKLLRAKNLSDSTINSLPGIFFIAKKKGEIVLWNKNFEILMGLTASEIKQLSPTNLVADDDKNLVREKIANVYKKGNDNVEVKLVSNDGTQTPFYLSGSAVMYEDELCLLCIGIDNSEKARIAKAMKESEEKYRLLFNENPLPMWIVTHTGAILNANDAATKAYGYSLHEFLAMPINNLLPAHKPLYDAWIANTDEQKWNEIIWEHQKKDGRTILVEINSSSINYNGVEAKLTLATDISEQVKAKNSLEESSKAFRDLATKIEEARETERTIMARDIHDELGQQLTGLKMDISWISKKIETADAAVQRKMKETLQLIDKTVITVRRISTALRPSILDDLGLIAAMDWQSEEFEKRFEIPTLFVSNISHISLSADVATGLFRIFQECLTNINRHAQATQIECNFNLEHDNITLTISDNGKGFKEEDIKHKKTLGLLGMKERVLLINGSYDIKGNAGRGVTVTINVPLNKTTHTLN